MPTNRTITIKPERAADFDNFLLAISVLGCKSHSKADIDMPPNEIRIIESYAAAAKLGGEFFLAADDARFLQGFQYHLNRYAKSPETDHYKSPTHENILKANKFMAELFPKTRAAGR